MTANEQQQHRTGLILVAMAAFAWSSAGIFTRVIGTDLLTLLFWRGLFAGTAIFILFLLIERRKALAILLGLRWPAFAVAGLSAMGMITGIGALRYTSIADAMVIYATVPFVTAGIAYVFIGERPTLSTMVASGIALAGVAIMLWGAETGGLFGKLLAFLMTLCMASFTTIMRRHREVAMLPAMGASAWICSALCWFFAVPFSVTAGDFALIALFGIMQNAAGLALYTFGSRRVPAAEATLLAALEVPISPVWVWLLLGEIPALQTLIGGGLVMAALFGHVALELRGKTREDPQPFQVGP